MNITFLRKSPYLEILQTYIKIFKPGLFLFGHGVTPQIENFDIQRIQLSFNDFEKSIDFLEKLKFRFLSMEEFLSFSKLGKKPDFPWVHLTFDDGYKNNLTEIYPYLKQKNIPFTIFISINHILLKKRFDNYRIACALKHTKKTRELDLILKSWSINPEKSKSIINPLISKYKYLTASDKQRLIADIINLLDAQEWKNYDKIYFSEEVLSVDELKTLSLDPIVHIGSHGFHHFIQTTLTEQERMFELQESKKILSDIIGKKIQTFCYPNGGNQDFSEATVKSCFEAEYSYCFTTLPGSWKVGSNDLLIPRYPLNFDHLPQTIIKSTFQ